MLGRGGPISMATSDVLQSRWALCPSVVQWEGEQRWTAFLTILTDASWALPGLFHTRREPLAWAPCLLSKPQSYMRQGKERLSVHI